MTNTIYHIIPDYESVSSCSSLDHDIQGSPPADSGQTDNHVTSQHNIAVSSSSLYSAIGKVRFAWTRPTANDNSTIVSSPSPTTVEANEKGKEVKPQNDSLLEERSISCEPKQTKRIFGWKGTTNHGKHFSWFSSFAPPPSDSEILQSSKVYNFSYAELKVATKYFCYGNELGKTCGRGRVYKGCIDKHTLNATKPQNDIPVAVKIFDNDCEGHDSKTEWLKHNVEQQNYHPNLVRLVGYCTEDEHRILVYEFMPHGSLEDHLFWRRSNPRPLSWSSRMKIALCAAEGLAFLHNAKTEVIHGNLKPSNILLDLNYNAKLSDSKLAKLKISSPTSSRDGYAAPEYYHAGPLTAKSDVYSFGVVLLEMLFGQRIVDENTPFSTWGNVMDAIPYIKNECKLIRVNIDQNLDGKYLAIDVHVVAFIALLCLSKDPTLRPSMHKVVKSLRHMFVVVNKRRRP